MDKNLSFTMAGNCSCNRAETRLTQAKNLSSNKNYKNNNKYK